jgi:hypothetical protein
VLFELRLSEWAQQALERLSAEQFAVVVNCLNELRRNPYRDMEHRVQLVLPLVRVYRHAYPCDGLAIAYHLRTPDEIYVDAIGPQYPDA